MSINEQLPEYRNSNDEIFSLRVVNANLSLCLCVDNSAGNKIPPIRANKRFDGHITGQPRRCQANGLLMTCG